MAKTRGYAIIGLNQTIHNANIGGAFRAAHAFGAAGIHLAVRKKVDYSTDTSKAHKHIPLTRVENIMDSIPYNCVPVAVDLLPGAESLASFTHPERAFYIFGAEDQTLPASITNQCPFHVYIPTTICLNLAATVNVVLYDRFFKEIQKNVEISAGKPGQGCRV